MHQSNLSTAVLLSPLALTLIVLVDAVLFDAGVSPSTIAVLSRFSNLKGIYEVVLWVPSGLEVRVKVRVVLRVAVGLGFRVATNPSLYVCTGDRDLRELSRVCKRYHAPVAPG